MSYPLVIIAGANQALFDELSGLSGKKLAPNGAVVMKPTRSRLSMDHADALLAAARDELKVLNETLPINTVVVTICEAYEDDAAFRQRFYPFALYRRLDAPDFSTAKSRNVFNRMRNQFLVEVQKSVTDARQRAEVVKGIVSKVNMSALVLPVRNFHSKDFRNMLEGVFAQAGAVDDVRALLHAREQEFIRLVPLTTPPTSARRCFSDGRHFFKSPGRHRHGYYKNAADGDHELTCLLNARSRLGGSLAHDFHFDCDPVERLDAKYLDCHDIGRNPKKRHVNIAPSDGII